MLFKCSCLIVLMFIWKCHALLESDLETSSTDHQELLHLISQEQSMRMYLESQVHGLQTQTELLQTAVHNLTASLKVLREKASQQVAFTAKLRSNFPITAPGPVVIFDDVITNIGHAYSTATGIFHCSISGLYLFSGTVLSDSQTSVDASIFITKNGASFARPYSGTGFHASGSDTAMEHLSVGDEVFVKYAGGGSTYVDHMSMFSGVLIKAD